VRDNTSSPRRVRYMAVMRVAVRELIASSLFIWLPRGHY
jgi:hypothetical protein